MSLVAVKCDAVRRKKAGSGKWLKNQYNRYLRRKYKNIKDFHPNKSEHKGWEL